MKKSMLIFGVFVLLNGITTAQDNYWNSFKQQFGYGELPERDMSRVGELQNLYENRHFSNSILGKETESEARAHEEGERRGQYWGRYEGARNSALGAAVLYGTYLGGKALYNWYRGPLHHIKSELQALKAKTHALVNHIAKHDKKTSSHQMAAILQDSVSTKEGILSLRDCENVFDVLKQAINEQEIADKKNKK